MPAVTLGPLVSREPTTRHHITARTPAVQVEHLAPTYGVCCGPITHVAFALGGHIACARAPSLIRGRGLASGLCDVLPAPATPFRTGGAELLQPTVRVAGAENLAVHTRDRGREQRCHGGWG
jgi:hypothetical protein